MTGDHGREVADQEPPAPGADRAVRLGAVLVLGAALVLRRPDALTHPQFWAEDGSVFFADAYNTGAIHALGNTIVGYFDTLPRLAAAAGVAAGFRWAPLISNLVALAVAIAPLALLLSRRFASLVRPLWLRVALAGLYVAMPNAEVHGNVTNAAWRLALLACLVVMLPRSRRLAWRVFDVVVVVLCGLTGPFVFALLPLAVLRWAMTREPGDLRLAALWVPFAVLQGVAVLTTLGSRTTAPLGAGVTPLVRIVANRVVVAGTVGNGGNPAFYTQRWPHGLAIGALLTAASAALLVLVLWRGPLALKIFDLFAVLVLATALIRPQATATAPQWPDMADSGSAERYFLIPMLAWMASLAWVAGRIPRRVGLAAAAAVGVGFFVHAAIGWQYTPYPDMDPGRSADRLAAASAGSPVVIPIDPPGWTMTLVKR